jgi:hypothetical protein
MAPYILNLGTRWRCVVSFIPWPFYPRRKSPWNPLCGPHSCYKEESFPWWGSNLDSSAVQAVQALALRNALFSSGFCRIIMTSVMMSEVLKTINEKTCLPGGDVVYGSLVEGY